MIALILYAKPERDVQLVVVRAVIVTTRPARVVRREHFLIQMMWGHARLVTQEHILPQVRHRARLVRQEQRLLKVRHHVRAVPAIQICRAGSALATLVIRDITGAHARNVRQEKYMMDN